MANLVQYLTQPLRKLFNTPEFRAASRRFLKPVSLVNYPFEWYPEPSLTNEGAKFKYSDGTELISYHIKGILPITGSTDNGFEKYFCSVHFPGDQGVPFIFPGSVTGMFMSGGGGDIITTPLANGGVVEVGSIHVPISSLDINFYPYSNPQEDGSYIYALVMDVTVENPDGLQITGLVSFDYEFLLPNNVPAPTLFQD
jgi:hypothetical protein